MTSLARKQQSRSPYSCRGLIKSLLALGIDVRKSKSECKARRGQPCEKPDCPRRASRHVTFWKRSDAEIYEALHAARRAYRERVKQLHPDKGGDGRDMGELAQMWLRIQRTFAAHGYSLDDGARHD